LCDSSDEDGMPSISLFPSTFSLHTSHFALVFAYSQYSIQDIPYVFNLVNCLQAMSFAMRASFELKDLNYDNLHIENVRYILTTFNGHVLFELHFVVRFDGHCGQMQGMDRKHDGHA
jgi:hypothetical protein